MSVKGLAAVGAHPGTPALLAAPQAANVPLITIDATVAGNPYSMGVPNDQVGTTSGQKIAAAAKDKLSGAWSGKNLVFIGLSAGGCAARDTRVQSGLAANKTVLALARSHLLVSQNARGGPTRSAKGGTPVLTSPPTPGFSSVGPHCRTVC